MSREPETAIDEPPSSRISVRRDRPACGLTGRDIARAVRAALSGEPAGEIAVAVIDDDAMADLHQRYAAVPGPTDVLTFDLRDDPAQPIAGDIAVSADTAARQAARFRRPPREELLRYVIHGILHLRGFDDHTPAGRRRMRREENRVLCLLPDAIRYGQVARKAGRR